MEHTVFILGSRGSVPVHGEQFLRYGGSTTCVFLRLNGQAVILDAGTGMLNLAPLLQKQETEISLLLSHTHVDHILGLPMCSALFDRTRTFRLYCTTRNGMDGKAQLSSLMSPPLWPIGVEQLAAAIEFQPIQASFDLGSITVDTMEGDHPGGTTLFRLTGGGKRIIFVTDCTLSDDLTPHIAEFAQNCDLLLCDGQYSEEEWGSKKAFGHSKWTSAARLGARCGAKQVRIIHHDPSHTDAYLNQMQAELEAIHPNCSFAYEGEVIRL